MREINKESLAEKIASLMAAEDRMDGLSSIQTSLDRINERLDRLENATLSPDAQAPQAAHPSAQHFAIAEAIADGIFSNTSKEKACAFEPNGKPCDHCSMCSSRGF